MGPEGLMPEFGIPYGTPDAVPIPKYFLLLKISSFDGVALR